MFIAIVGLILLIAGFGVKRSPSDASHYGGLITKVGIAIIALGVILASFKIIEPGKVGVQTLFGKVQDDVLPSGLHVINPLVDITTFSIQTENYTMSAVNSEGQKEGDDAIRVLSSDGLEVTIDLSVLYKVDPNKAPFIFQNIGPEYVEKIVRPVTRTAIRDNAVNYQAVDLYSVKRQEFQERINRTIAAN